MMDIIEIKKMLNTITSGKWRADADRSGNWGELVYRWKVLDEQYNLVAETPGYSATSEQDAEFIARAPEIIGFLLSRIAELDDALRKIAALPESCTPKFDDSARIAALVETADIARKALGGES